MNAPETGNNSHSPQSKQQKRSLLDDWRVRAGVSVLLAILAWMIVTIIVQPGTTITLRHVPVDFTYDSSNYTSKGLSIVSAPAVSVDLTVSGDGFTIGRLTSDDFVVYPDWSSVRTSGEKSLRLKVECISPAANDINIGIDGNNTVTVVFDVVEELTLPITVITKFLTVEDGYILYNTAASAETVTLSGPSSELSRVATCTAELTYDGGLHETQTLDTALRFYTESGSEVFFDYVTLDRENVDVTLTVYKLAELPVNVRFINTPSNFDDSVLIYSLSQDSLRVAGPEAVIDGLTELAVGTIDLSSFTLDRVYEMPISLPSGIVSLDNISSISVSFDCSALTTKTLNLPAECVQVINLPSTYQLTVETERLMNVVLCGPADALEGLTPEQVVVEIDANDFSVVLGQQNIACSLYVPANGQIFALGSYTVQCRIESK